MRRILSLVSVVLLMWICGGAWGTTRYVNGLVSASGNGLSWETALRTIQEGIDAASDGDTVAVAKATYFENVHFDGKNIVLTSTDPLDPTVVQNTIIDGNKAGPVVSFRGTEGESCVLSGFTITNGIGAEGPYLGRIGGGIHGGGPFGAGTSATIENNVVTGNSTGRGGGIAFCDGIVRHNKVVGNSVTGESAAGGGIFYCNGIIEDNVISQNSAGGGVGNCQGTIRNNTISANYGSGISGCDGTIEDNTIAENVGPGRGGGLYYCGGTIQNNTITGNSAYDGGGLSGCGGTIQNNAIIGNSADDHGGGLLLCDGAIQNNTMAGNSANLGGGLYQCDGTIQNCIIWGNKAPNGPQLYESSIPTYSCIQDWSGGGQGNIASEPRFLDLNAGDYRLQEGSPCIDAGYNDPGLPATDIVGMHRIMFGGKSLTVDMGAYEFYINTLEPIAGRALLTWSSLADKTYSILYTDDLPNWHTAIDRFPSFGDTTTCWVDDGSLTGIPPSLVPRRFYRILENP